MKRVSICSVVLVLLLNLTAMCSADTTTPSSGKKAVAAPTVWSNKEDVLNAIKDVDANDYVKFRGPILQSSWIPHHFHFHHETINDNTHVDTHALDKLIKSNQTGYSARTSMMKSQHQAHHDKKVCHKLFAEVMEVKLGNPSKDPPEEKDLYTLGGHAKFTPLYETGTKIGSKSYTWSSKSWKDGESEWKTCGHFADSHCAEVFPALQQQGYFQNATVLNYGFDGISPWIENALLHHGARQVISVHHDAVTNQADVAKGLKDKVRVQRSTELAKDFLTNKFTPVDVIFAYGSIEHEGLGKLGEEHNPWADLESVGRFRCLLKSHGLLILGIPVGEDNVVFNARRIYGKARLTVLKSGWELESFYADAKCKSTDSHVCRAVFVLKKQN